MAADSGIARGNRDYGYRKHKKQLFCIINKIQLYERHVPQSRTMTHIRGSRSATWHYNVAKSFAASRCGLIFVHHTQGRSKGLEIAVFSMYPKEREVLYIPLAAPDIPLARQEQERQEAGRRYHRSACHPADVLGNLTRVKIFFLGFSTWAVRGTSDSDSRVFGVRCFLITWASGRP